MQLKILVLGEKKIIENLKKIAIFLKNTILKGVVITSSVEAAVHSIFYWHITLTRAMICMLIFVLMKRRQGLLAYIPIIRRFVENTQ